jgi:hypothetical protein
MAHELYSPQEWATVRDQYLTIELHMDREERFRAQHLLDSIDSSVETWSFYALRARRPSPRKEALAELEKEYKDYVNELFSELSQIIFWAKLQTLSPQL